MKNSLSLPEYRNYEYGYNLAFKLAGEQLAATGSLEERCRKSGAEYKRAGSKEIITLEFLNQLYRITFPGVDISMVASDVQVPVSDKVLILHYLARASGVPLSNKLIAFQELPEGGSYMRTFSKRSIEPLVRHFGGEPKKLVEVAKRWGGLEADYGDVAVTVNGFKLVPVTLVLWQGDDEFPPRGNILFDSTIPEYLSTYDITVLCDAIVWRLVRASREESA
jgi:hypothetical protein